MRVTAVPRSFRKKGNPPLVVVAATFLDAIADGIDPNPFTNKFIRLRFSSPIPDPDERRLIATWGCIRRRVFYSTYAFFSTTPNDLCLDYQDSEENFIPDDLNLKNRNFYKGSIHGLYPGRWRIFCCWLRVLKRYFVDKAREVPGVQGCSLKKSDSR